MEREMIEPRARLDVMETTQKRVPEVGDISDEENEEIEVKEAATEDDVEKSLLRAVVKLGARVKIDIPMYELNLYIEELLDWIRGMDKYFDNEDVEEEKNVRYFVTRLKGNVALCWDELQADRRSK
jgi:glycyl-tRNA synthetase beta subunit